MTQVVVVDSDIKAKINKPKPCKIFKYHTAYWNTIREEAVQINSSLLTNFRREVNENWICFKTNISDIIAKQIPSKMSSSQNNLPWLSQNLKKS